MYSTAPWCLGEQAVSSGPARRRDPKNRATGRVHVSLWPGLGVQLVYNVSCSCCLGCGVCVTTSS